MSATVDDTMTKLWHGRGDVAELAERLRQAGRPEAAGLLRQEGNKLGNVLLAIDSILDDHADALGDGGES